MWISTRVLAVVLILAAVLFVPATSLAAQQVVTSTADSGPGSLRQAIADATAGDTIVFSLTLPAVITTDSTLTIDKNLTIAGPGPSLLTVRRNAAAAPFGVFINNHVVSSLSGLTISGGAATASYGAGSTGGGILNYGDLTVSKAVLTDNTGTYGGGIWTDYYGNVTFIDSTITTNRSDGGYGGGGIFICCDGGSVTLIRSTVSGNSGGSPTAMAIYSGYLGTTSAVRIQNSTIDGTITNEASDADVVIDSSTITSDEPRALIGDWYGTLASLRYRNSIFRGATGVPVFFGIAGSTSLGYNIFSDETYSLTQATDHPSTDPKLGPLQNNGGPTFTRALLVGSPAIDAGDCARSDGTMITSDQRGILRPRGNACDIGAFEAASDHELQLDQVAHTVSTQLDAAVSTRATQASVDAISQSVNGVATSVGSLSTALAANEATVQALAATAIVINGNVLGLVPAIQSRASQTSVNDVSSSVTTVSQTVNGLTTSVTGVSSAVEGVATSVNGVSSALADKATQASVAALSTATTSGLAAINTSLQTLTSAVPSQSSLNAMQLTLSNIDSSLASKSTQTSMDALTRYAIERALGDGAHVVTYMLPANAGGQLDAVRQIVDQAINGMRLMGIDVTKASAALVKGDNALAAGNFRTAYDWYASAYQLLIK